MPAQQHSLRATTALHTTSEPEPTPLLHLIEGEHLEPMSKQHPLVKRVDQALEGIVGTAVLAELIILFANILTRTFFDFTILWANEFGHLVLTVIAFVGGALAYNRNEHIAVHAVIDRLPGRWRPALDSFIDWMVLIGSAYMAYVSLEIVQSRADELSTVMEISMRWFVLPLLVGLVRSVF